MTEKLWLLGHGVLVFFVSSFVWRQGKLSACGFSVPAVMSKYMECFS